MKSYGILEMQLHGFITSALDVSGPLHALVILPTVIFEQEAGLLTQVWTLQIRKHFCACQESNPYSLVIHPVN